MIVNIRLEVSDEQRRELTRRLRPNALSKLATRKEVSAFVAAKLEQLDTQPVAAEKRDPEQPVIEIRDSLRGNLRVPNDPDIEPFTVPEGTLAKADPFHAQPTNIEKHGTGIRRGLFHVNNAIFALNNAYRVAGRFSGRIAAKIDGVTEVLVPIREEMTELHDKEQAA